jgi:predicted DNA-binding protein (MmcQ/YjbR family)
VNLEELRQRCLALPGTEATYPFGAGALVMKVGGKMYAVIAEDAQPVRVTLKCEPEIALRLRAAYPSVVPGYHANKRHWNTVTLDGRVDDEVAWDWIVDSYDLVVESLPRRLRSGLEDLTG